MGVGVGVRCGCEWHLPGGGGGRRSGGRRVLGHLGELVVKEVVGSGW